MRAGVVAGLDGQLMDCSMRAQVDGTPTLVPARQVVRDVVLATPSEIGQAVCASSPVQADSRAHRGHGHENKGEQQGQGHCFDEVLGRLPAAWYGASKDALPPLLFRQGVHTLWRATEGVYWEARKAE